MFFLRHCQAARQKEKKLITPLASTYICTVGVKSYCTAKKRNHSQLSNYQPRPNKRVPSTIHSVRENLDDFDVQKGMSQSWSFFSKITMILLDPFVLLVKNMKKWTFINSIRVQAQMWQVKPTGLI